MPMNRVQYQNEFGRAVLIEDGMSFQVVYSVMKRPGVYKESTEIKTDVFHRAIHKYNLCVNRLKTMQNPGNEFNR